MTLFRFHRRFIFCCLLTGTPTLWATTQTKLPEIHIDRHIEEQNLSQSSLVLFSQNATDLQPQTLIESLIDSKHQNNLEWQPNQLTYGYIKQGIWIASHLVNTDSKPIEIILSSRNSSPREYDFYIYDETGQQLAFHRAGTQVALSERHLPLASLGIQMTFPAGSSRYVLIWQKTRGLLDTSHVIRSVRNQSYVHFLSIAIYSVYFGIALALLCHNLSLFLSMRDKVYLSYLAFIVTSSMTALYLSGFHHLFWWRISDWISNLPYATPSLSNITAVGFLTSYLRLSWRSSRLAQLLWLAALASLINSIVILFAPILGATPNAILNLIVVALASIACFHKIIQGETHATYLLMAVLAPIFAILTYYTGNLILKVEISDDIIAISFTIEMLLMSVGLSARVANLRQKQYLMEKQQAVLIHQSRLEASNELAASVAHEVNNPLMILSAAADVIDRILSHPPPYNLKMLNKATLSIHRHTNRIAFIVQSLKLYAEHKDEPAVLNVPELVQRAFILLETKSYTEDVTLDLEKPERDARVVAHPGAMLRVIYAVFSNAINAAAQSKEKLVRLSYDSSQEQRLLIRISDSGPGIPHHLKETIFRPILKDHAHRISYGLSLSQSRQYCESIGGALRLESNEEWTTFVIELPNKAFPSKQRSASKSAA